MRDNEATANKLAVTLLIAIKLISAGARDSVSDLGSKVVALSFITKCRTLRDLCQVRVTGQGPLTTTPMMSPPAGRQAG